MKYVVVRTDRATGEVRFFAENISSGWTPNRSEASHINESHRNLKMKGLTAMFNKEFKYTDEMA